MARPVVYNTIGKEVRDQVRHQIEVGVPIKAIAQSIGMGLEAFYKHFDQEIAEGRLAALSTIGGALMKKVLDGDTAAIIFACKTRLGMADLTKIDVTSSDGSLAKQVFDYQKLSTNVIEALLEAKKEN